LPSTPLLIPSVVEFKNAFYLKLGRGGSWEEDAINTGKLRFGWTDQTLEDINAGRWDLIEGQLREQIEGIEGKPKGEATKALHGLRMIAESGPEDIWITFYQAKLWWTRVDSAPVEQDDISKFRRTAHPWKDGTAEGRVFTINGLPGRLAQIQGFRWTVCRVPCPDLLRRTLSGARSDLATAISSDRAALALHLTEAIKELHWKDFETLVDLVFRAAGWVRISVLGQYAKAYDLELQEPITGHLYIVQVKSQAGLSDLKYTVENFSDKDYKRLYFIVHSPSNDLANAEPSDFVEVMPPDILARHAMDAGLAGWLEEKVS
jgi:hypothetical protein